VLQRQEDYTALDTCEHGTRGRQVFRLIVQAWVLGARRDEREGDLQTFGHLGVVHGHLGEFCVQ
jgi:hypothetical protein